MLSNVFEPGLPTHPKADCLSNKNEEYSKNYETSLQKPRRRSQKKFVQVEMDALATRLLSKEK